LEDHSMPTGDQWAAMPNANNRKNPFPGLRPFEPSEKHLFFGREEQVAELVTRLRKTRFLAVVGTSGSGKSSLVFAGLLPCLYGGIMRGAGSRWHVARFRPGSRPIANLAKALLSPDAELFRSEAEKFAHYDPEFFRANVEVTLEQVAWA
jgi:energy-coupling factor transporter ATP-binding protein EcfA2